MFLNLHCFIFLGWKYYLSSCIFLSSLYLLFFFSPSLSFFLFFSLPLCLFSSKKTVFAFMYRSLPISFKSFIIYALCLTKSILYISISHKVTKYFGKFWSFADLYYVCQKFCNKLYRLEKNYKLWIKYMSI